MREFDSTIAAKIAKQFRVKRSFRTYSELRDTLLSRAQHFNRRAKSAKQYEERIAAKAKAIAYLSCASMLASIRRRLEEQEGKR